MTVIAIGNAYWSQPYFRSEGSRLYRVNDEWLYLTEDEDLEKKPPLDPWLYPHIILDSGCILQTIVVSGVG